MSRAKGKVLAYGLGRSYGDSCVNDGGAIIKTSELDGLLSFDPETGILVCQAGLSLHSLIAFLRRRALQDAQAWFPAVVPGTQFVTIGGAIANDVHGKNHPSEGSFGCHVEWLELARSDGRIIRCSRDEHEDLFGATIGGLGLTGLIQAAAIRLQRVPSHQVDVCDHRVRDLDHYYDLVEAGRDEWPHQACWVDVLAKGAAVGRGILTQSRFSADPTETAGVAAKRGLGVPFDAPNFLIGNGFIRAFNRFYRWRGPSRQRSYQAPVEKIFFPLDALHDWNRLYGKRGFYQYQCVIPAANARGAIHDLLSTMAEGKQGSFLTVLKELGPKQCGGPLSFPMEGTTLAVDFPNNGARTLALLDRLDRITVAAKGRLYPAKDGRMSPATFAAGFTDWSEMNRHIDPKFSSSFWRRVTAS